MVNNSLNSNKSWYKTFIGAVSTLPKKILLLFHYQLPDDEQYYDDKVKYLTKKLNWFKETSFLILYGFYTAIYYYLTVRSIWDTDNINNITPKSLSLWVLTLAIVTIEHAGQIVIGLRLNIKSVYLQGNNPKLFHVEVYTGAIFTHTICCLVIFVLYLIFTNFTNNIVWVLKIVLSISGFLVWGDQFVRKLATCYEAVDVYEIESKI